MPTHEITQLQRIFLTRLDTLSHLLDLGEQHLPDMDAAMQSGRLAPDMLPLGAQVAFACNQPRGFSQWCAGQAIENIAPEVPTLAMARGHIADAKAGVSAIAVADTKLDETKRVGLGAGRYCDLSGRMYVSEYLLPNVYFHITTAYAILRHLGVPVGKSDYMRFLAPLVRTDAAG